MPTFTEQKKKNKIDLTPKWILDLDSPGGQINANFVLLPTDVQVGRLKDKIRACF